MGRDRYGSSHNKHVSVFPKSHELFGQRRDFPNLDSIGAVNGENSPTRTHGYIYDWSLDDDIAIGKENKAVHS